MKFNRVNILMFFSVALAACVCVYLFLVNGRGSKLPQEQAIVSNLAELISSNRISKIEIFYIPLGVATIRAITPTTLFLNSPARVVSKGEPELDLIRKALINTKILPDAGGLDVRVGFVAFDIVGVKVASIAISPLNGGYVNETSCYFKGNMKKVLANLASPPPAGIGFKEKIYNFILLNR